MAVGFTPTGFAPVGFPPSRAPFTGYAWGELHPDPTEAPVPWPAWEVAPGVPVVVDGDASWGAANLAGPDRRAYGPVVDTGDTSSKTITAETDKYATGAGAVSVEIRGQAATFNQHDDETVGPVWAVYSTPVTDTWRYVQLRLTQTA